jgi:hypothetical protein
LQADRPLKDPRRPAGVTVDMEERRYGLPQEIVPCLVCSWAAAYDDLNWLLLTSNMFSNEKITGPSSI